MLYLNLFVLFLLKFIDVEVLRRMWIVRFCLVLNCLMNSFLVWVYIF